jgi:K+-transporting ATPase ATPase B chain
MAKRTRQNKLFESSLVNEALKQSFVKLSPRIMIHNPVMFTVEICTAFMLGVCIWILAGENLGGLT